jgi:hypothetical protein
MGSAPSYGEASPPKLFRWRISRIRAEAEHLGYVNAPDQERAIEVAIRAFGVTDPYHQRRLMAQLAGEPIEA